MRLKIILKEDQDTIFEAAAKDLKDLDKHMKTIKRKLA